MEQPSDDTPSVTPVGRASSLREGAGNGGFHSSNRPENPGLRAIFIAPTKGFFHSSYRSNYQESILWKISM